MGKMIQKNVVIDLQTVNDVHRKQKRIVVQKTIAQ